VPWASIGVLETQFEMEGLWNGCRKKSGMIGL